MGAGGDRRPDRALRGRAARGRLAELGARQPRPPAASVAARAGLRACGRAAAAHPARDADALLRRRDRHARRRDRTGAPPRPVGVRQPRPRCGRRCSGTPRAPSRPPSPGSRSRPTTSRSTSPPSATTRARCSRSTAGCSRCAAAEPDLVTGAYRTLSTDGGVLRFARGDALEVEIDFGAGDGTIRKLGSALEL